MWSISEGPKEQPLPDGGDGVAFVWRIERENGAQRTVRVEVARSALAARDMPYPIPSVVKSQGEAAVAGFLDWVEPPEVVRVTTKAIQPLPGSTEPSR